MGSGFLGAVTSIVVETSAKTSTCVVKIWPELSKHRFAFLLQ
jgi:hypothetical protein